MPWRTCARRWRTKCREPAALVYLAQIYRDYEDLQRSLECATAALEGAPVWEDVMLLRADVVRSAQVVFTARREKAYAQNIRKASKQ